MIELYCLTFVHIYFQLSSFTHSHQLRELLSGECHQSRVISKQKLIHLPRPLHLSILQTRPSLQDLTHHPVHKQIEQTWRQHTSLTRTHLQREYI